MELKRFKVKPRIAEFDREGEKVSITYNADIFTPEFFRLQASALKRRFKDALELDRESARMQVQKEATLKAFNARDKRAKNITPKPDDLVATRGNDLAWTFEQEARMHELERDFFAELLGNADNPIILDWDVTDNGEKVPVTVEVFKSLPPALVRDLYNFCSRAALPKSPGAMATAPKTSTTPNATTDGFAQTGEHQAPESPVM